MSIGQRIKKVIKNYDLSQENFATKIGVTRQRIGNIVNDKNQPNAELLAEICEKFESINARWLLTGKGYMFEYGYEANKVQEEIPVYKKDEISVLKSALEDCRKEKERAWEMVNWLQGQVDELKKKEAS
jgi:transcriptional regulator with XRE-family HTH domain